MENVTFLTFLKLPIIGTFGHVIEMYVTEHENEPLVIRQIYSWTCT